MEQSTLITDETHELLEKIKNTKKHKDAIPLIKELEEVLLNQEEQIQNNENTLQVQISQLKEENKRLNRL
jgi:hypothetical protein